MLLETAAGLLDGDDPEQAIRREAAEETGHNIGTAQRVFDVYMSPGSVTERLHFFAAPYDPSALTANVGGIAAEGEDITTVELPFADALGMIRAGEIVDAKTIMLLQWAALDGPFRPPRDGLFPVAAEEERPRVDPQRERNGSSGTSAGECVA